MLSDGTVHDLDRWRRKLSRRGLLRAASAGAGGLALAGTAGCSAGRGAPKPQASATGTPQRGGTLRRRSVTDAYTGGFAPNFRPSSQTGEMGFFYQGLVRLNPETTAVEPELAQKWEQPSQTEYVFHLQPGVKWHNKAPLNGRMLTADDVVSSLDGCVPTIRNSSIAVCSTPSTRSTPRMRRRCG